MLTERDNLAKQLAQLQTKLNNLAQEAPMQALLRERDMLVANERDLVDTIDQYQQRIKWAKEFIRQRETAKRTGIADKRIQERLARCKKRLKNLLQLNAPSIIIENEKRMIWEMEGPVDEVRKSLLKRIKEEQTQDEASLQKFRTRIAEIETHYQETKKCLKEMVAALQTQLSAQHQASIVEKPQVFVLQPEPVARPKSRRKRNISQEDQQGQPASVTEKPWKLFFVESDEADPICVPQKRRKFEKAIQRLLDQRIFQKLNLNTLHERLLALTQMDMTSRQRLDQIYGNGKFHGWKKVNLGDFRILVLIDEQKREIRFSPKTHDVYQEIHRGR